MICSGRTCKSKRSRYRSHSLTNKAAGLVPARGHVMPEEGEQLLVPGGAQDFHIARAALRAERSEPRELVAEVDGLAPRCPFLSAPSCRHLADHAGQHIGRRLPADDVKTLESLIDEIERVPAIGEGAVRLSGRERDVYPIPKMSSPSAITSPRLIPTRNSIRFSGGMPALRSAIPRCTSTAHRTASTTLGNLTKKPSPVFFTIRPLCSPIFGLTSSPRCSLSR
jgi:hypothetical protein